MLFTASVCGGGGGGALGAVCAAGAWEISRGEPGLFCGCDSGLLLLPFSSRRSAAVQ